MVQVFFVVQNTSTFGTHVVNSPVLSKFGLRINHATRMRVTVVKILSNKTQHNKTIQKCTQPKRFFIQTQFSAFLTRANIIVILCAKLSFDVFHY